MKSILSTVALLLLCLPVLAHTGLKEGERFENHRIQGQIRISCHERGQSDFAYVNCRDSYLTPSIRSKFTFDSGVNADKVKLTYTNSDGKTKTKSSRIKGNESRENFNLWIWTLTQRPLLKSGENTIEYKLTNNGSEVESGSFDVLVETLPVRTCGYRSYTSSRLSDCRNASMVCAQYFRQMNDCL
ncbi:hypothetical protein BIY24_07515 [Halobacteriovorax marinus]|uniref:hypothetical protein n=1 Tax=Halobacteriovorax marinus TaxID=97084 RepID=UPI000BC30299|nr:hypothetical protein [Halobacteriovorax marinus]ATH07800.1 hypothetical protein BIY24_07515 [Halobacteriovorax marinus]